MGDLRNVLILKCYIITTKKAYRREKECVSWVVSIVGGT